MRRLSVGLLMTVMFMVLCVYVQADDLVLHLAFDDDSGSIAKDLSAFGNDATFQGNSQWIPGRFGQGLEFDGSTWGEVPDAPSLDLTSAMTIETWALVRPGGEAIQSALEKGNAWKEGEYNLAPLYNGGTILQMADLPEPCNDDNVGTSIQDGQWHFLVGTWDGNTLKLYIDGSLNAEMPCVGTLLTNDDPLYIGARGGTARFLIGALDEIKVYDFALTEDEILQDMEGPTSVEAAGKLATTWARMKAHF